MSSWDLYKNAACLTLLLLARSAWAADEGPRPPPQQEVELLRTNPGEAVGYFERACRQELRPWPLYALARAHQALARYEEALANYRRYRDEAARGERDWKQWQGDVKEQTDFCLKRIFEQGRQQEQAGNFDKACERFAMFDRLAEGMEIKGRGWNREVLEGQVWNKIKEERASGRRGDALRHLGHYEGCFCGPLPTGRYCQEVPGWRAGLQPPPPPPVWKRPWFIATMSVVGLGVGAAVVVPSVVYSKPAQPPVIY